jgi:hypothetical protein
MNCYVCAREQLDSTAVAVCPRCGAGLCLLHVSEEAGAPRRGGLYTSCTHDTWSPPSSMRADVRPPDLGYANR